MVDLVWTIVIVIGSVLIGSGIALGIAWWMVKRLLDDIFKNTMPIVEDEVCRKIKESPIVDTMIEKMFESFKNTIASQKGVTKRQEQAMNKRLVRYILQQYPVANTLATESGAIEYLEKNPALLFSAMNVFPGLFGGGSAEGQPQETINTNIPIPPP